VSDALISILIPCYNAAPWLEAALRSAQAQTWPRVEIVVVDDGSTDGSGAITRRFESSRCQVLSQPHRGASAARNRAFAEAQGDFIQYLDADDLLAADKLERQMRAAEGRLSFGSVIHFFDSPERGETHLEAARWSRADPVEFLIDLWGGDSPLEMVQPGQWLTPRALIEQAGPWNEGLSVDDDGEFFARVILAAERIVAVTEALAYYRKFREGRNLSARGCRQSSMQAAKLKSGYLLERSENARARAAVRRLVSREIVGAYPDCPEAVAEGIDFLRRRGLELSERLEGSPWFLRLYPRMGWKATRRLQWGLEKLRRKLNGSLRR
jgi:hypothetical protein